MLRTLRQRVTSDEFDTRLAEWVAAVGALAFLVCGHLAVERLGLFGLERLAGYGLVLVLTLLLANLAVLFSIRSVIGPRGGRRTGP